MANIPDDIFTPATQKQTQGKSILILTADKTEDLEFFYPYYRFIEEGYKVDVATPDGKFKGKNGYGLDKTKKLDDVSAQSYDFLYIPGGKAPAELKKNDKAVAIVKDFAQANKPIASICHGPQLLAEADVIRGCKIAAWPEVEDEVTEAGATYVNQETVADGLFVTGRWPADLPSQVKKTLEIFQEKQSTSKNTKAAA